MLHTAQWGIVPNGNDTFNTPHRNALSLALIIIIIGKWGAIVEFKLHSVIYLESSQACVQACFEEKKPRMPFTWNHPPWKEGFCLRKTALIMCPLWSAGIKGTSSMDEIFADFPLEDGWAAYKAEGDNCWQKTRGDRCFHWWHCQGERARKRLTSIRFYLLQGLNWGIVPCISSLLLILIILLHPLLPSLLAHCRCYIIEIETRAWLAIGGALWDLTFHIWYTSLILSMELLYWMLDSNTTLSLCHRPECPPIKLISGTRGSVGKFLSQSSSYNTTIRFKPFFH